MPQLKTLSNCITAFHKARVNGCARTMRRKLIRIGDISHRNSKSLNKRYDDGHTTDKSIKTNFFKLKASQIVWTEGRA